MLVYDYHGFFPPVDDLPLVNTVKNGATLPLKWRLLDAGGHHITELTTMIEAKHVPSTCGGSEDPVEETLTAGGTQLRWDEIGQQFIYNWKTPSLPGKCVRLVLRLDDGTTRGADFKLK